jgi:hypothetical protein
VRDAYAAMTRPAAWPFFDDLHIDPTGHLWVQRFRAPWAEGGTRTWWVFAPDGRHLGAVVFPGALDVHQITEDAVVGVVTDELGVERVQAHRLRRPMTSTRSPDGARATGSPFGSTKKGFPTVPDG